MRSFKTNAVLASVIVTTTASCNPGKDLVAKTTAAQTYYTASYEHKCKTDSDACKACRATINDGVWKIQTANVVYKIGPMPSTEKSELETLMKDLQRSCPP